MKLAFLYAGQGSQTPGMGKDLYESSFVARQVLDEAAAIVDFDLLKLTFEGTMEILSQTQYTQPCMVAFEAAVTAMLRESGLIPHFAAGLSLGEYSALCCAGVFTPAQGVGLVRFRGQAMERAAAGIDSRMSAVLWADRPGLEAVCREVSDSGLGFVGITNCNCPGQTVIGGHRPAVEKAEVLAKERGAKKCIPLNVSGPFHTPLMAPAAKEMALRLTEEKLGKMEFPVVFNTTGRPLAKGERVEELLIKQVESPTLMEETILWLADQGIDTIVEIGPGQALSGFVKKTAPQIKTYQADSAQSIARILSEVKGE